jgi:hypothetical protein
VKLPASGAAETQILVANPGFQCMDNLINLLHVSLFVTRNVQAILLHVSLLIILNVVMSILM